VIKLGEDPAIWQDNQRAQELGKENAKRSSSW
jgi:hypothetical protein